MQRSAQMCALPPPSEAGGTPTHNYTDRLRQPALAVHRQMKSARYLKASVDWLRRLVYRSHIVPRHLVALFGATRGSCTPHRRAQYIDYLWEMATSQRPVVSVRIGLAGPDQSYLGAVTVDSPSGGDRGDRRPELSCVVVG
uniref:Uncharacterized protein n=1 Tax=Plectus sambesii TaxID=2011161 RepID=A0A914WFF8_9BILA